MLDAQWVTGTCWETVGYLHIYELQHSPTDLKIDFRFSASHSCAVITKYSLSHWKLTFRRWKWVILGKRQHQIVHTSFPNGLRENNTSEENNKRKQKETTGLQSLQKVVIYKKQKTAFDHISKHWKENWKNGMQQSIVLRQIWHAAVHCLDCLIYLLNRN